jgi:hypothetical protein
MREVGASEKEKVQRKSSSEMGKCKSSCMETQQDWLGWPRRSIYGKEDRSQGKSWKSPHEKGKAAGYMRTKQAFPTGLPVTMGQRLIISTREVSGA